MTTCEHHRDLWTGTAAIISNEQVADRTWKITLSAKEFAQEVKPGQFLMLRLPLQSDPLLGRAFAVYSADRASGEVSVIYLVVGKMTALLTKCLPGDELKLTGPLGNGWQIVEQSEFPRFATTLPETDNRHFLMVAGGIGQTPFYLFAKEQLVGQSRRLMREKNDSKGQKPKLTLLMGAQSAERLCGLDDFTAMGVDVQVATEDGSAGQKGFVTDLIEKAVLESGIRPTQTRVLCCGPTPMLKAAWKVSERLGLRCWVSLESSMSCGLGICYGCVVRHLDNNGQWDYRRTCVDGPVFDAARLEL